MNMIKNSGLVVCLLLVTMVATAQIPLEALILSNIASIHRLVDHDNAAKIGEYRQAVRNYNFQVENGRVVNPKPIPPMLAKVNDARVRSGILAGRLDTEEVVDMFRYVPTAILSPAAPSKPKVLVGTDTGSGEFACVIGDASPNGTKYKDARGSFIKALTRNPFGSNCKWLKQ